MTIVFTVQAGIGDKMHGECTLVNKHWKRARDNAQEIYYELLSGRAMRLGTLIGRKGVFVGSTFYPSWARVLADDKVKLVWGHCPIATYLVCEKL